MRDAINIVYCVSLARTHSIPQVAFACSLTHNLAHLALVGTSFTSLGVPWKRSSKGTGKLFLDAVCEHFRQEKEKTHHVYGTFQIASVVTVLPVGGWWSTTFEMSRIIYVYSSFVLSGRSVVWVLLWSSVIIKQQIRSLFFSIIPSILEFCSFWIRLVALWKITLW